MRIHFLGGASTVTGSKFLVEHKGGRILVDCGLFQGLKSLRELNWNYLPVEADTIDAVILTHGHLDHCGFLPRLREMGFRGSVYCTAPTAKISRVILLDSARIQEEEAERANRYGYTRHRPAMPLYTEENAKKVLEQFHPVAPEEWVEIKGGVRFRLVPNGHILGSTYIDLDVDGRRLVFSGDLGRLYDPLLPVPNRPKEADIIVMESTYGNRFHESADPMARLGDAVERTLRRGGTVLIPSFAVERTQLIMYYLWMLQRQGRLSKVPMYIDSPMGASVMDIFEEFFDWHKLDLDECREMCAMFHEVATVKETYAIRANDEPKIVIAGSGMLTGGRILHYLTRYLQDESSAVVMVGFQAEGTRGRSLLEGERELKIFGEYYPVKAEVALIMGLSAHADQDELLNWLYDVETPPEYMFLVHGERQASDTLRRRIVRELGWEVAVPELYTIEEFD